MKSIVFFFFFSTIWENEMEELGIEIRLISSLDAQSGRFQQQAEELAGKEKEKKEES